MAAKGLKEECAVALDQHTIETIQAERQLHMDILGKDGAGATDLRAAPMSLASVSYTNHVLATVSQRPFVEGLAAYFLDTGAI